MNKEDAVHLISHLKVALVSSRARLKAYEKYAQSCGNHGINAECDALEAEIAALEHELQEAERSLWV